MSITQIPTNEYRYLNSDDLCYYFLHYTKGGYEESKTNSLVLNFKKPIKYKSTPQWYYKTEAIKTFARLINVTINKESPVTVIPCATSNPRGSIEFDSRLDEVALALQSLDPLFYDAQFCLDTTISYIPAHSGGSRDPQQIKAMTSFISPTKTPAYNILLIDDVFATGSHFRAYKDIIQGKYPTHQIIGVFLAKYINI